ncbi:MAG TPA: Sec-independent protein translocase protein TatB [Pyrinomonadaceae bacterium]|nr:Sec-independent protein translocase protein TatB [Pyrinomonadaceae bacterium]
MFLFILESIGTSELILIGIVALMFLGPRRLPEIAKKIGKIMAEFRGTANEFKSTWEREVDFEEESKALRLDLLEDEAEKPVARENSILNGEPAEVETPSIKKIDKESFDAAATSVTAPELPEPVDNLNNKEEPSEEVDLLSDKRNWL